MLIHVTTQHPMIEHAAAKTRRLIGALERDAAEMASKSAADENLAPFEQEGQRVIAAALVAARRLLVKLQAPADASMD